MGVLGALGALVGLVVLLAVILALAIPLLIVWLLVELLRGATGGGGRRRRRRDRYDPAAEALRTRYARGEITQADFEFGMRSLGYVKR
jgi:uncharacterized membrane protein